MVAVIAGNGLGLFNTSATQLGQTQGGQATIGQANARQYVNVATGNLVLQGMDDGLVFDGLALNVLRTYNSQGQLWGSHGWAMGFGRSISGLSGSQNSAGSTVVRTDDDGSATTYTYDATRGLYVSTGQSGAEDTLSWDGTSSSWRWSDGATLRQETYDATGKLTRISSPQAGSSFSFTYANGVLSQIAADDGDTLTYTYNASGQLSAITIKELPPGQSVAVTRQQVAYAYDASGRLASVTTTLGSDTDATSAAYVTSYSYDGSSDRIASIRQSDGTQVSYAYTQGADGSYRVIQVVTGNGTAAQVQNLTYGDHSTTVSNARGDTWSYQYDNAGELTKVIAPAVNGASATTTYRYDGNGNLLESVDPNSGRTQYLYSASGDLLSAVDGAGNTVTYTYNADHQVLSKTTYAVAATGVPGQSGYVPASGGHVTYYVYDSADRLAFVVDPDGGVTERDYQVTAAGISVLASSRQYLAVTFDASSFSSSAPPALSDLDLWTSSAAVQASLAHSIRTDYRYDARGQLSSQTQWNKLDAQGNGVADAGSMLTTTAYDAHGRILQSAVQRGSDRQTLEITSYAYDGLGRLVSQADPLGNITSYIYDDSANTLSIIAANGLITTQVRNSAGQLVSSTQAMGEAGAGNPGNRVVQQPTLSISDAQNQITADIAYQTLYIVNPDGAGEWVSGEFVTISQSGTDGSHLSTLYAVPLSAQAMAALQANPTLANLQSLISPSASDQVMASLHDAQGSVQFYFGPSGVSGTGALGEFVSATSTTGNLIQQIDYAAPLSAAQLSLFRQSPNIATLRSLLQPSAADRVSLLILDGNGQVVAKVSKPAPGAASNAWSVYTSTFDSAGRQVANRTYAAQLTDTQVDSLRASPTLATLQAMVQPDGADQVSLTIYDAAGHITAVIYQWNSFTFRNADGSQQTVSGELATTYTYDSAGHPVSFTNYATPLTDSQMAALGDTPTLDQLQSALTPGANDQHGWILYDTQGRIAAKVGSPWNNNWEWAARGDEQITTYTYDAFGNRTSAKTYVTPLTSAQIASLGSAPTLAQVQALISHAPNDEISITVYDDQLRMVASISSQGQFVNEADGSVSAQSGYFATVMHYDSAGRLVASTEYGTPLTMAQIIALGDTPSLAQIQGAATAGPNDRTTLSIYDANGNAVAQIAYQTNYLTQPDGSIAAVSGEFVTLSTYDAQGNPTGQQMYVKPLSAAQVAQLVATPTLDALQAMLAAMAPGGSQITTVPGRAAQTIYDAQGRQIVQVDALGNVLYTFYDAGGRPSVSVTQSGVVTANFYDAAGQLIQTTVFANRIDISDWLKDGHLGSAYPASVALPQSSTGDRSSLAIFDAQERPVATVDMDGHVVVTQYDAAGHAIAVTRYATPLTSAQVADLAAAPSLEALLAAVTTDPADLETLSVYDGQGRLGAAIDASGVVTTYGYDAAGNVTATTIHATALTAQQRITLGTAPALADVLAYAAPTYYGMLVAEIQTAA